MIPFFVHNHQWLHNNAHTPLRWQGLTFPSVLHAFQAARTSNVGIKKEISTTHTSASLSSIMPKIIQYTGFDGHQTMEVLLRIKFGLTIQDLNPRTQMYLAKQLIQTGLEALEYGNHTCDTFWGVCHCARHKINSDLEPVDGTGQNVLGNMLMEVRDSWRGYIEETNEISIKCQYCSEKSALHILFTGTETPTVPSIISSCLPHQALIFTEASAKSNNQLIFSYNPFEKREKLGSYITDKSSTKSEDSAVRPALGVIMVPCPHCQVLNAILQTYCSGCFRQVNFSNPEPHYSTPDKTWMGTAYQTPTPPPERTYTSEDIIL
jgi:predicted NAD-dependent protein-ADP-ribosyltransferase YbiA (DUF1768 family)